MTVAQQYRRELEDMVLTADCDDFEEHGAEAIRLVREAGPAVYIEVAISLLPRQTAIAATDRPVVISDRPLCDTGSPTDVELAAAA
jgi:hypothetical protein